MKVLLIDTLNSTDILNVCFALKKDHDILINSKIDFSDYHLNTISNQSLTNILSCFNPEIVLIYGEVSSVIETLILHRPNRFFIISILKGSNTNLNYITQHSVKVLTYEKDVYEKIKDYPSKEIILVESEDIYKNLLNNLKRQPQSFEIIYRPTQYGIMGYVKNDIWFVSGLVSNNEIFEAYLIEVNLRDIIKKSKYIFDIGAHSGSHTIVYSSMNPESIIYCFEPQSVMYQTLLFNLETNQRNKVKAYNLALGKEVGILRLSASIADGPNENQAINFGSNNFYNLGGMQIGTDGEEVLCDVLDNYDYGGCDFIKIDVEGFEALVLAGGINLIKKYRPTIFFEYNNKKVKPEVIDKLNLQESDLDTFEFLRSLGYTEFKQICDNYLTIYNQ